MRSDYYAPNLQPSMRDRWSSSELLAISRVEW
jgi:hypothetical protein